MSNIKKYLIFVIDSAGDSEKKWANKARAKRNHSNFRNARFFSELEACDGVVLGKGVANAFPKVAEVYQQAGVVVEDLDADATDATPVTAEKSDNVYEWTRQECLDWLEANEVELGSGYQSRSDLQSLVIENING